MRSSVGVETRPGGALLFVRNEHDLAGALRAVNDLLACRRSAGAEGEALVGVVVGAGLEGALAEPVRAPGDQGVTLRESVGLAGIWSLCWFESLEREARSDPRTQRRLLLERLSASVDHARAAGDGAARPLLVPVLAPGEARDDAAGIVDALAARYPTFAMSRRPLVHDPARGGVVSL